MYRFNPDYCLAQFAGDICCLPASHVGFHRNEQGTFSWGDEYVGRFPKERPAYPESLGPPQAGLCKNCKEPIPDEIAGFCEGGTCWAKWCEKQEAKANEPK